MERIKTLETRNLCESAKNGGCGECQTSCQSACKTSCGVANQSCENTEEQEMNSYIKGADARMAPFLSDRNFLSDKNAPRDAQGRVQ